MSQANGRVKLPKFMFVALGIASKLLCALVLFTVVQNYYELDIRISHVRPLVAVQLIVVDKLPHFSTSNLLKFTNDLLNRA